MVFHSFYESMQLHQGLPVALLKVMYFVRVFCFVVMLHAAKSAICPGGGGNITDIDWKRFSDLKWTWYDVIDVPFPATPIDCWDFLNFKPTETGVTAIIYRYVEGGKDHPLESDVEFIRNDDGTYSFTWTKKTGKDWKNVNRQVIAHKTRSFEDINRLSDMFGELTYFFKTDYKDYFLLGTCIPGFGMGVYIKFREQVPSPQAVMNVWDWFSEHDTAPRVYWKDVCAARSTK